MAETINQDRRRLIGAGAAFVAAALVGRVRAAGESSFSTLKEINAGVLNVGYAEAGPASGKPVILVHGCRTTFTHAPTWRRCSPRRATA